MGWRSGAHIATLEGHADLVDSVEFSADGSKLASASLDNTARLWMWDGKTGTHIATLAGHPYSVNSVTFSADGFSTCLSIQRQNGPGLGRQSM